MSNVIQVGFSMHPRWLGTGNLDAFLEPLREAGLSAFEFELDSHLDGWDEFEPIMEAAVAQGMQLSFHAPYRYPYYLLGFAHGQRRAIEDDYRPLLAIAEKWARRVDRILPTVIHAAKSELPAERDALIADTETFLRWVLDEFPHLHFALENNHPASQAMMKVGVSREEVLRLVSAIQHPRLGVCWDMGHDYLQHKDEPLTEEWLSKIVHVHVHDVNEAGDDHYPLIFGRVPYGNWLQALKRIGMRGIVVLELKGSQMVGWDARQILNALTGSIRTIAKEVG